MRIRLGCKVGTEKLAKTLNALLKSIATGSTRRTAENATSNQEIRS
jgi:hypothetical protein